VRRHDPDAGELDIELVLHGDGPASAWAASVAVGDTIHVAGPRTSHVFPATPHVVLIGDETAMPTICRWIDESPPGTTVSAVFEVDGPDDEITIDPPAGVELDVTHVHRRDGRAMVDGLRSQPPFPPDVFVFAAGEHGRVSSVRVELRDGRSLDPSQFYVTGYWRHGATDPESADLANGLALIDLADLLTPFAIRVMATLGLADLIDSGVDTVVGLAEATASDADTLGAVVGHLVHKQVLSADGDRLGLTGIGLLLRDGHPFEARQRLHLDGAEGHMDTAWAGLLHAVRTGRPGFDAVYGRSFWDEMRADATFAASFDVYLARWASVWTPAVAAAHDWNGHRHVVDVGGGSGLLLAAILEQAPSSRGTLVELEAAAEAARATFAARGIADRCVAVVGDFFEPLPEADALVLAQVVHDWPDDDAVRILRRAAEAVGDDGRVFLVERVRDAADGGAHGYMHLLMRNLFAAAERTLDELTGLAASAGLALGSVQKVNDELSLIELAPAGTDR
jgi:SAM-dependent methyltransferase